MEKVLGIKVTPFFASDYAGVIEAMRFRKVDAAWMGNKSAMEAVDRANAEVFAQVVSVDGSLGYYSYMTVHRDSPYKTMADIFNNSKNISFGMGDPNSTSGFLVPSYYLFALNKVEPKSAFKVVRNANHETNMLSVYNRQIDVAVHSSDSWERLEKRSPETASALRQIWKSPIIPSDPVLWRRDIHTELKQRLKTFFLGYGRSGANAAKEKDILVRLTFSGFVDSSNAQLKPIRQLELFREKTKIESDMTMNIEEKTKKLDAINQRLNAL
jgi:phosphonate transport system substrate-binding protein